LKSAAIGSILFLWLKLQPFATMALTPRNVVEKKLKINPRIKSGATNDTFFSWLKLECFKTMALTTL
jgi:hypothetical protein